MEVPLRHLRATRRERYRGEAAEGVPWSGGIRLSGRENAAEGCGPHGVPVRTQPVGSVGRYSVQAGSGDCKGENSNSGRMDWNPEGRGGVHEWAPCVGRPFRVKWIMKHLGALPYLLWSTLWNLDSSHQPPFFSASKRRPSRKSSGCAG